MKTIKHLVYCDESGNTGGNYIDKEQPFFVMAGLMLPQTQEHNTACIEDCAKALKVNGELKGNKLLGSGKSEKQVLKLMNNLIRFCLPTFIIAEKRYCIACKIVETALDNEYNSAVTQDFSWNNVMKKEYAEVIYGLSDNPLEKFAEAYDHKNKDLMIDAFRDLCVELEKANQHKLRDLIIHAIPRLEENMKDELDSLTLLPNKALKTLQLPVFVSYLMLLEEMGRRYNVLYSVIHDELKIGKGLESVFKMYKNASETHYQLADGRNIFLGWKHVTSVKFCNSEENLWIQAADLFAAALYKMATSIYQNKPISNDIKYFGKQMIQFTILDGARSADTMMALSTFKKIWEALNDKQ